MRVLGLALVSTFALSALLMPPASAQGLPSLEDGTVSLAVEQRNDLWEPLGPPGLIYRIEVSLGCGTAQAADPRYDVALSLPSMDPQLKAALARGQFSHTFDPASCVNPQTPATQSFNTTLTLSADPTTEAFRRIPVLVNATLREGGQSTTLDGAEATTNLTVGFAPGLLVNAEQNVQGLVNGRTEILLRLNNTANGPARVAATLSNQTPTLTVDAPVEVTLDRSQGAPYRLVVTSPSGCPEPLRRFTLRLESASTDPRGVRSAEWIGEFVVSCEKEKSGIPAPPLGPLLLAALAGLLGARRRR